jgi:hypothetical protein
MTNLLNWDTIAPVVATTCKGVIYRYRKSVVMSGGKLTAREEIYPLKRMSCTGDDCDGHCSYEAELLRDYIDDGDTPPMNGLTDGCLAKLHITSTPIGYYDDDIDVELEFRPYNPPLANKDNDN